jgi:Mrp family chromosome partitioning ATPase
MSEIPENANEGCVGPTSESAGKANACAGCPNQGACSSGAFSSPEAIARAQQEELTLKRSLENVSHVVLVLSGKGGVGKSTVAAQLSHALAARGYATGLLDVDLCGPSAPRMAGVADKGSVVHRSGSGAWTPVYASPNLAVMSISFLLQDSNAAVVWRGPRKNSLIQQFLTETDWTGDTGGLDYLIVDTPPGTSDEHISTVNYLQKANAVSGAIVVTTPEEVSMADVRKELNFCQKTKVPVLGVVENMSSYQKKVADLNFLGENGMDQTNEVLETLKEKCPEVLKMVASTNIFPVSGTGPKGMADQYSVEYWGTLPLDSDLLMCCEQGRSFVEAFPEAQAAKSINGFIDRLVKVLPVDEVDNMQQ